MNNHKLTVVMTTYNRAGLFLREAIEGVLNQTYRDFEFVVIDHGSTDNTREVIGEYKDERIRYKYVLGNEDGMLCNLQRSVYCASTKYVIWTHDDDYMLPDMLSREVEALDSDDNIALVGANADLIDDNGDVTGVYFLYHEMNEDYNYDKGSFIREYVSKRYNGQVVYPICPTMMYRTDVIKDCFENGDINENTMGATLDMFVALLLNRQYRIRILHEVLFQYRIHKSQGGTDYMKLFESDQKVINPLLEQTAGTKEYRDYYQRFEVAYLDTEFFFKTDQLLVEEYQIDPRLLYDDIQNKIVWDRPPDMIYINRMCARLAYLRYNIVDGTKYLIWGSGTGADVAKHLIDYIAPQMHCDGFVDGLRSGEKDGLPIIFEEDFDLSDDRYIIVAAQAVGRKVVEKLQGAGKKIVKDFLPCWMRF